MILLPRKTLGYEIQRLQKDEISPYSGILTPEDYFRDCVTAKQKVLYLEPELRKDSMNMALPAPSNVEGYILAGTAGVIVGILLKNYLDRQR